ncbi:MAG: hypothetical protein JWN34_6051 [Bryobacterales bacterium]|nr:hypothetical protein [Bryobacterales bacterium]
MHTDTATKHHENTPAPPPIPFDVDLSVLVVGAERVSWLSALIDTARAELRPRDFAERHYVDEMAINKWRLLRIYAMEKAVYEHHSATFRPRTIMKADGEPAQPNQDLYHLAKSNQRDQDAVVLAALSRLEARFHRQLAAAHRMFLHLRKTNPFAPYPTQPEAGLQPETALQPETNATETLPSEAPNTEAGQD